MARPVCQQLFPIPKAPSHTDGSHPAIHGGLHIHTGISYVENIFFGNLCYLQDIIYHGRVRFHIDAFTLAEYCGKTDIGEIVGNKFFGSRLVLV